MKNVLITGGAGFIGTVLAHELLAQGHRVRVLDNLLFGGEPLLATWNNPEADFVIGDITSASHRAKALENIDTVIHLAAIVGDPASSRQPELTVKVNLDATRDLVQECVSGGVERFVFASTCSNYGVSAPDEFVTEDSSLNPVSVYAETKVAAEQLILDSASPKFDTTVLRLSTVYGVSPRMRFDLLVNDFAREAFARKKIVIFGEQFWRPHIHVYDVARAMSLVAGIPTEANGDRVFNVGRHDQNFQKQAIAEMVVEQAPETELEFVHKDEDPRSYRVRFDRIKERYGFDLTRTAQDGVGEVLRLLSEGLIENYDDPKFKN
jgi:nucleoside-diphosphate-sugar epimerase